MDMKKGIIYIVVFLALCLYGCEGHGFSEDCERANLVQVSTDWKLVDFPVGMPDNLDLYLYQDECLVGVKHVDAKKGKFSFLPGSYKMIACNNAAGLTFRNMGHYETAEIGLFTTKIGEVRWAEQPDMFVYDTNASFRITNDESTPIVLFPKSALKTLELSFEVKSYWNRDIRYLNGSLSGLATKMNIHTGEIVREEDASQAFYAVSSKEFPNLYKVSVYTLGVIPKMAGQKNKKKILTLNIEYVSGEKQSVDLDLSDAIDNILVENKLSCKFDLVISSQSLKISLTNIEK